MPTIGGVTETAAFAVLPGMSDAKPADPINVEIGKRITAGRIAVDLSQKAAAAAMGVSTSALGNWETGWRPADPLALTRLAKRYGLSLDWFYRDEMGGVRHDLRDHLAEVYERLLKEGPRRGRPFGRKASSSSSPPAAAETPRVATTKARSKRRQGQR